MEWWEDAKKLTEVRKARNVSQARLARMAGVTASLICQIEKGTKPLTKEVAQKVWDALAELEYGRRKVAEAMAQLAKPTKLSRLKGGPWADAEMEEMQKNMDALAVLHGMGVDKTPERLAKEEAELLRKENERLRQAEKARMAQDRIKDRLIDALQEQAKIQRELIALHGELRHVETQKTVDLQQRIAEYRDLLGLATAEAIARSDADEQREKILSVKDEHE